MRIVLFCHSLVSDWNHGNAHFLRGIATELQQRGHELRILEPLNGWSLDNLRADCGEAFAEPFATAYPTLCSEFYDASCFDVDAALDGADLVIVHEWTAGDLIGILSAHRRAGGGYRLLFHDTHHRSVTAPDTMPVAALAGFDGVLAFGAAVRDVYQRQGWSRQVWVWHEAADTGLFRPPIVEAREGLVWIGNWGDGERTRELREFLVEPIRYLGIAADVYGVRYPSAAQDELRAAGIAYRGYLPNPYVPAVFGRHRVTVHVPRGPYARALPGIPTIRVFEALACGIPLVSAPWDDSEGLFEPGADFLVARDGPEMRRHLRRVVNEPDFAADLGARGRRSIMARHSCAHRVDELLAICRELGIESSSRAEVVQCGVG
ncbi:MAG: a-glycosyltransferase, Glycosyltransferase Family 4-like protein [Rhodospirillales bacterium]|nr:a-glycosyltransferase, Glycosyltransferase Family 4-like protein [Rhodospirillales bacterium]